MKLSIFTPTHNPTYLLALAYSLEGQDYDEWCIVVNSGVTTEDIRNLLSEKWDDRWRVIAYPEDVPTKIGAIKNFAASSCTGDILMEVDHDDLLLPQACSMVKDIFAQRPEVGFLSSDCGHFMFTKGPKHNGKAISPPKYDVKFGWEYETVATDFGTFDVPLTPPICPTSVTRIWYAPDHLRAWRATTYRELGGHNPEFEILDDQELVMRTYLHTIMAQIRKPLYLYRRHTDQTFSESNMNAIIQTRTLELYHQYIERCQLRWCELNGLKVVDLGSGKVPREGYEGWDIETDVDLNQTWPAKESGVGCFLANDIFEHLHDRMFTIRELYRCLAHGGVVFSQTPNAMTQAGWADPTHVSAWVPETFRYFTDTERAKWIGTPVRFQELYRSWDDPSNTFGWTYCHALALKEGTRPPGLISI